MVINGDRFDTSLPELTKGWRAASGDGLWSTRELSAHLKELPVFKAGRYWHFADLIVRLQGHWKRGGLARRVSGNNSFSRWMWTDDMWRLPYLPTPHKGRTKKQLAAEVKVRAWFDFIDEGLYDLAALGAPPDAWRSWVVALGAEDWIDLLVPQEDDETASTTSRTERLADRWRLVWTQDGERIKSRTYRDEEECRINHADMLKLDGFSIEELVFERRSVSEWTEVKGNDS